MNIEKINQQLLDNLHKENFAGYDVFDGLNSALLKTTGLYKIPIARLAWIQFFKRSPVNFRRLVGVPKRRNPKGIALVILGLLEDYTRKGDSKYLKEATGLGDWLLDNRSDPNRWQHHCWGYHFPWEARAFHVPIGKPNIITTCYVVRSLWELRSQGGDMKFMEAANDAGCFIAEKLYTEDEGRCFFAYIPGETTFVHNASLWGAAIVAKTAQLLNNEKMSTLAYKICMQSVREQMDNGAWPYGSRSHHGFIDGFHTGYNLEALDMARQVFNTSEFDESINKGLAFYRNNFFLSDGMPKYYHNSIYPIDMHLVSQAVLTLIKVGRTEEDQKLAEKTIKWAIDHMYLERNGYFRYQITRWFKNNICYMRWTQAWAYYSLAFYLNAIHTESHGKN